MNRRELIRMVALATGGVVIGAEVMMTGCKVGSKSEAGFSAANIAMLDEVGETIIPATNTPGAKAAQIGAFMKTMVTDCYTQSEQNAFTDGMGGLEDACKKATGKTFMEATPQQRKDFLITLEKEAKAQNDKNVDIDKSRRQEYIKTNEKVPSKDQKEFDPSPSHYYTMMKQLTLLGFFTSKTGMTETLRTYLYPESTMVSWPITKATKPGQNSSKVHLFTGSSVHLFCILLQKNRNASAIYLALWCSDNK